MTLERTVQGVPADPERVRRRYPVLADLMQRVEVEPVHARHPHISECQNVVQACEGYPCIHWRNRQRSGKDEHSLPSGNNFHTGAFAQEQAKIARTVSRPRANSHVDPHNCAASAHSRG